MSHSTSSLTPLSPPINIADFHSYARSTLPKSVYDYYRSGALDENSLRENENSYQNILIVPRVLRDVSSVSLHTKLPNGLSFPSPIFIAPTAMHCMAHVNGEKETAKASASLNTLMCLSSLSTTSLEDVAKAQEEEKKNHRISIPNPYDSARWFQLYVYSDRSVTLSLVKRAELCGYQCLVVTVDTPVLGTREADVRNGFSLPNHLKLANFEDEKFSKNIITKSNKSSSNNNSNSSSSSSSSGIQQYVSALIDKSLQWKDIAWLQSITSLPIILKGIHSPLDAILAIQHKVSGIIVSNHGARQLDGVPSTIDMLQPIVTAVNKYLTSHHIDKHSFSIYLDGGIRRGSDVFKALALGAKGVFIGRPVLWGLTHSGQKGVERVMNILNEELKQTMQLAGVQRIEQIDETFITNKEKMRPKL